MLQFDCRGLEPYDFDPRVGVLGLVTFFGNHKESCLEWMDSSGC
ncbi:hypothetical protein ANCCEY_12436 [Ancylostoma ceylanicum]|uniref:Uncharacterized protein n=1 Tax=Ancylostoma ceylanicum TaxID=53326 RepID=A0A0D6LLH6_9BILA|nr:hypothetical protein ANCCEY_12436 [Ancylostoma ceylanicum]